MHVNSYVCRCMEISVIFKAKHELMCSEKTLISDISTWYQNYLGSSRDNLVTFSYTKHFYCCEKNRKNIRTQNNLTV